MRSAKVCVLTLLIRGGPAQQHTESRAKEFSLLCVRLWACWRVCLAMEGARGGSSAFWVLFHFDWEISIAVDCFPIGTSLLPVLDGFFFLLWIGKLLLPLDWEITHSLTRLTGVTTCGDWLCVATRCWTGKIFASSCGDERGKLLHHDVLDVNFLDYGVWDAVWMGIFSIMRI